MAVEGLALAQLAPGRLAAQLAIYLGWVRARVLGATLVALAFVGPSFLMFLALSALYLRYGGLPWMDARGDGRGAFRCCLDRAPLDGIGTISGWLGDRRRLCRHSASGLAGPHTDRFCARAPNGEFRAVAGAIPGRHRGRSRRDADRRVGWTSSRVRRTAWRGPC